MPGISRVSNTGKRLSWPFGGQEVPPPGNARWCEHFLPRGLPGICSPRIYIHMPRRNRHVSKASPAPIRDMETILDCIRQWRSTRPIHGLKTTRTTQCRRRRCFPFSPPSGTGGSETMYPHTAPGPLRYLLRRARRHCQPAAPPGVPDRASQGLNSQI